MIIATKVEKIFNAWEYEDTGTNLKNLGDTSSDPQFYPWIKVGRIYCAPTFTNDMAWLSLIQLLKSGSNKKFALFTGRHGDAINYEDSSQNPMWTLDVSHTVEDTGKLNDHRAELLPANVELVCVNKLAGKHLDGLRDETKKQLLQQRIVVYAWCYSFYTWNATVAKESFIQCYTKGRKYELTEKCWKQTPSTTREDRDKRKDLKSQMDVLEREVGAIGPRVEQERSISRRDSLNRKIKDIAIADWNWIPFHPLKPLNPNAKPFVPKKAPKPKPLFPKSTLNPNAKPFYPNKK